MKLLVTGGAGFIGSAFVRYVIRACPEIEVLNLDKLTYAGNLQNLAVLDTEIRHQFVRADICDERDLTDLVRDARADAIVHFAAESHVDRSILSPSTAIDTNVRGTANLLAAAHACRVPRFLHVSTDEVYGDIDAPAEADEQFPVRPSSPYAASKAASDLLALSYVRTYGLPVLITRASNNYGPYQFPEKLIPLTISRAIEQVSIPLYGDGQQVRDWLYVEDHCRALFAVLRHGRDGEIYNVAGNCSLTNRQVIDRILDSLHAPASLVESVVDRAGHDRRYALSEEKISRELGFVPETSFDIGLARTIEWYRENSDWIRNVKSGEYRDYYRENYAWRSRSESSGDAPSVAANS